MKKHEIKGFADALNNAVGDAIKQIESGEISTDNSLYDLIMSNTPPIDNSVRNIYEEIKKAIDVCGLSNGEIKTLINSIGFHQDIPLDVKLFFVLQAIIEFNTERRKLK